MVRIYVVSLLLSQVAGCVISEEQSCAGCHRDCGSLRPECHEKCDASPACGGKVIDEEDGDE